MSKPPPIHVPPPSLCMQICVKNGLPNSKVSVLRPNKVQVVIPGVDDKEQIGEHLKGCSTRSHYVPVCKHTTRQGQCSNRAPSSAASMRPCSARAGCL